MLALVLTTFAAGCDDGGSSGSADSPATGRSGGQLVWGTAAEVQGVDPTLATESSSWQVLNLAYDSLLAVDEDLELIPQLATSWKRTSPTSYVFEIRKGVKFSNGRAMTVDDVVGSLRRIIDPKTAAPFAGQLGIRRVARAGEWRVRIDLEQPRESFLAALAGDVAAAILPIRELRSGDYNPKQDVLGTGPFKVVDHNQDESWTFERNPHYWREGEPKVDRLVVRILPEDAARVAALRDGTIDVATFDTPDAVQLLENQPGIETVVQETTDYYRLDVNAITSPFRDARLREALSLAIDRNRIRELALAGLGKPSAAAAPGFEESCDPAAVPYAEPDIDRARRLVETAGARGKKVSIMVSPADKTLPQIAQVVQQSLEQTGLEVDIEQLDAGELLKRLVQDESAPFDLAVGYFVGLADPAMVLVWWNPIATQWNKAWLPPDQQLIRLVDEAVQGPGGADRQEVLQQACDRIARDANIIPLVTKSSIVAYRSDKVSARIQELEPYTVPLRHIAEFTVKG